MVSLPLHAQAAESPSLPGVDPGETFRFAFRRHWLRVARYVLFVVSWTLVFLLFALAWRVLPIDDPLLRRAIAVILSLFFLIPHIVFLAKIYKHFLSIVVVTDKKIHHFQRTLLTVDSHKSVDLWVLQDIDKTQRGIIQNLFGFGNLRLEAQNSQISIYFVPHIDDTYNKIVGLREEARKKLHPGTEIKPSPTYIGSRALA